MSISAKKCLATLGMAALACSIGRGEPAVHHPADLEWREAQGVKIPIPPKEHPRLYLRGRDVADLKRRAHTAKTGELWARMQKQAKGKFRRADEKPMYVLSVDALSYLINDDEAAGRRAAKAGLALLKSIGDAKDYDRNVMWWSRKTGRQMCSVAAAYDWCYGFLSDEEKNAYVHEFMRLIPQMENHYPPRGGTITGHGSEKDIMRDQLSVGIAIYDEFPEVYELAAARLFKYHFPARNWFYPGGAYHQGDSYGPSRFSCEVPAGWIFDRLGAGQVYRPEQVSVIYPWIYGWRSDGQIFWNGDSFSVWSKIGEPRPFGDGVLLSASYWNDPYAMNLWAQRGGEDDFFALLWMDPQLATKPFSDLPLSYYAGSPFGWMYARSGWDDNAVICEMKINEMNFCNHQHMDAGAFQVYHKGMLALDSGVYQGAKGGYGSPHCRNYYWRTIAHNSLLVYDPDEEFLSDKGYGNDGGQRMPNTRREPRDLESFLDPKNHYRTGDVTARGFGPDAHTPEFTWLAGDITKAYNDKKVREVKRSFAFVNTGNAEVPGVLFVYDRVESTNPSFKKFWLLHTIEEPALSADTFTVDRKSEWKYSGRMLGTAILPEAANRDMHTVGGPGKEFWVFGKNYPQEFEGSRKGGSGEPGAWRIEISPKAPAAFDEYLNAMQMMDAKTGKPLDVQPIVGDAVAGARIGAHAVVFARSAKAATGPLSFDIPGQGKVKTLVVGLAPGKWSAGETTVEVGNEDGAAIVELNAGSVVLKR